MRENEHPHAYHFFIYLFFLLSHKIRVCINSDNGEICCESENHDAEIISFAHLSNAIGNVRIQN